MSAARHLQLVPKQTPTRKTEEAGESISPAPVAGAMEHWSAPSTPATENYYLPPADVLGLNHYGVLAFVVLSISCFVGHVVHAMAVRGWPFAGAL